MDTSIKVNHGHRLYHLTSDLKAAFTECFEEPIETVRMCRTEEDAAALGLSEPPPFRYHHKGCPACGWESWAFDLGTRIL